MPLAPEHEQVREAVRRFAEGVVRPAAGALDREERYPAEIYRQMAELGLIGIAVPADHGGAGMDTAAYAIVMEELARGYASVADQCGLIELVATLLHQHGTDAQRAPYLAPLLRAERRPAYALTEAEAGSDLAALRTTALRDGAGWSLSGSKLWIHNAPVCDFAVVLARTDKAAGHRGMSIFLVDRDLPGFVVGAKEHKMGQRASQVGALTFDDIALPPEALLGTEGRGFHMMMSVLDRGRIGIGALAVGIAQAGLEAALGHARTRRQFSQELAAFQGIQWLLADMAKDIQAARLLVRDAADREGATLHVAGDGGVEDEGVISQTIVEADVVALLAVPIQVEAEFPLRCLIDNDGLGLRGGDAQDQHDEQAELKGQAETANHAAVFSTERAKAQTLRLAILQGVRRSLAASLAGLLQALSIWQRLALQVGGKSAPKGNRLSGKHRWAWILRWAARGRPKPPQNAQRSQSFAKH
jgi:alkylation response protein AidB-like acyl-CoA dehydrogenase